MTVSEMHDYFKSLIDKMDSLNYPNFEPEEIDLYLNEEGQDALVKLRYSGRPLAFGQAFEETQKRTDDLRILVTNAEIPALPIDAQNKPNSRFFQLPQDYWFAVNEEALVERSDCNGESVTDRVRITVTSHDDYTNVIRDPFKRPNGTKVLRLMFQDKAELIGSPTTNLVTYILRYIRKPIRISLSSLTDCELPDHLHQEVVKMAVAAATRATQPAQHYEMMLKELSKQE
jgi:hypothetical protein